MLERYLKAGACRHDVVGGDLIPYLDRHRTRQGNRLRNVRRRIADIGSPDDFHGASVFGGKMNIESSTVGFSGFTTWGYSIP